MKKVFPFWPQNRLAREIALTLVVKLVVIVALYHAFFADHGVTVDPDTLADHIANPQHTSRTDARSAP